MWGVGEGGLGGDGELDFKGDRCELTTGMWPLAQASHNARLLPESDPGKDPGPARNMPEMLTRSCQWRQARPRDRAL